MHPLPERRVKRSDAEPCGCAPALAVVAAVLAVGWIVHVNHAGSKLRESQDELAAAKTAAAKREFDLRITSDIYRHRADMFQTLFNRWHKEKTMSATAANDNGIELGDEVRDAVTGLSGVVICRMDWLHGCVRFLVQPKEVKDGKPVEASAFDAPQLVVTRKRNAAQQVTPQPGGAPSNETRATARP